MITETAVAPAIETKIAEYSPTAAGLAELAQRLKDRAYDLTTTKGDKEARADRLECVRLRTSLEAKRKELKAPALERSRLIDEEAKRITSAILALEEPIDEQIKAAEAAKEAERQAKAEAERKRVAGLRDRIARIGSVAAATIGRPSAFVQERIDEFEGTEIGDDFAEFKAEALAVHAATLTTLREMHAAALAQEAEAARLAAERLELERLRREQAERERVERDRLAAEAAAQRAQIEREQAAARAAQEEADRVAKAARAEEDRQAAAARAEADRIAREERAAEAKRQAEERAELQRKADALAAEKRQRDEAEEMARLEAQRAAAKVEKAGPVLLAALVIAIPYVAEHGTADDLATCNAAIAAAT